MHSIISEPRTSEKISPSILGRWEKMLTGKEMTMLKELVQAWKLPR
jgi:hypothetical protein